LSGVGRGTPGAQFRGELSLPSRAAVTFVGGSELAWQQWMVPRRLHADDATAQDREAPGFENQRRCPRRCAAGAQVRTVRLTAVFETTVLPLTSRNDAAVQQAAPKFAPSVDCPALAHWTGIDRCSNGASTLGSAPIRS
jgi:hypothetical protein